MASTDGNGMREQLEAQQRLNRALIACDEVGLPLGAANWLRGETLDEFREDAREFKQTVDKLRRGHTVATKMPYRT